LFINCFYNQDQDLSAEIRDYSKKNFAVMFSSNKKFLRRDIEYQWFVEQENADQSNNEWIDERNFRY
jgi:hypothetical protein